MAQKLSLRRLLAGCVLALLAASASALEVILDDITAMTGTGEVKLRVDSRARFQFDPETSVLTSAGTWTGQYAFGPNQLIRFSHKVEDFSARPDGRFSMRSYECVEGTLGALVGMNNCGNYRFGENGIDDGGTGDDEIMGPRKSLASFIVSALTWDGNSLLVILSPPGDPVAEVFVEYSLKLEFSNPKPALRRTLR